MKHLCLSLCLLALLTSCNRKADEAPITLHPENPHYFLFKGKPTVLITSGEHYGAVLNLDFDYAKYLETLAADGLNLTRVFTGAYVEPVGAFKIEQNTLAPQPGRFICPWPRTDTPGYANGGNKFDLTKWDDEYFKRLKDFVSEADKRNIIVELALFCPFYGDHQWQLSPMNNINNINGAAPTDRTHVYTLDKSESLLAVQENLVKKIIRELKEYNNLIYEICNEPYFGGVTMEWQHHMATLIREEEMEDSHPHLISQNIANGSQKIENPHPSVSVFNFHYATPPIAVGQNYHLDKVIGDNETGFKGNADSTYRKEGWAFILAGGALYNNLDYSFTQEREDGTFQYPATQPGGGSPALRKQLQTLHQYISGFEYLRMKPDTTLILNQGEFRTSHALSEQGRQYGIYIFGKGPIKLQLSIPEGTYDVEFMDPLTGKSKKSNALNANGTVEINTPPFQEDVAIKILRSSDR
ncbi:MAG: cellulase family glycosylhydrolase [Cyclobacteriaceae bacterium]